MNISPPPADFKVESALEDILKWFPDRKLLLVGDGGYSGEKLLGDLDKRVRYVGLMRGDAALHNPNP